MRKSNIIFVWDMATNTENLQHTGMSTGQPAATAMATGITARIPSAGPSLSLSS